MEKLKGLTLNNKKIFGIVVLIIIVLVVVFIFQKNNWTLFVCDAEKGCYENKYIINGFKSLNECTLTGAAQFNGGFECGKGCEYDKKIGEVICEKVCNSKSECHE
jgi:hypothetical protein